MATFQKIERAVASFAITCAGTTAAAMMTSALHLHWYMTVNGLTERAQLSEDYGFAFENVLFLLAAAVIAFPASAVFSWRLLGKLGFGERRR